MKELLLSPFFMLSAIVFTVHQVVEKILNIHYQLLDNYLDNLLFFPIILTLVSVERILITKNKTYQLSILEIATITIFLSIFFEEIVPQYFHQFTKDYYDYIAYFLGAIIFYFQNKIQARS